MLKSIAQRVARYVLRDELNILNNRVFQAQCCESMALDLSEERALMCNELAHQVELLKDEIAELRAKNNGLRIDLDNGSNFTYELMAELRELRKQLHAADHDNAFLYEQLKELHLDKEKLRQENDELRQDLYIAERALDITG